MMKKMSSYIYISLHIVTKSLKTKVLSLAGIVSVVFFAHFTHVVCKVEENACDGNDLCHV